MAVAWTQQQQDAPSFVKLLITSSVASHTAEKRYRKDLTISELKCKLELVTGCDCRQVKLELYTEKNELVATLNNNDARLYEYPVVDGMILKCTDPTKSMGHYDVQEGEEFPTGFELSYEEYLKRPNTFVRWLKENKLGRFREKTAEEIRQAEEAKQRAIEEENNLVSKMNEGDRCEVSMKEKTIAGNIRGTVMFLGETKLGNGKWVGVRLDEPFGMINKNEYFDCEPKYGVIVKPQSVVIGDYPELTPDDLDEI